MSVTVTNVVKVLQVPTLTVDTAADNLDYLIDLLSEHDDLMKDVSELCYSFVEDVSKQTKQMDIQYLLG